MICAALSLVAAQETPSPNEVSPAAESPVQSAAGTLASATMPADSGQTGQTVGEHEQPPVDYWSMLFVFVLATFIGLGVIARVSRLLHTPLMSITNAISAIAVVGSIIVTGADYPTEIRLVGAIALFASMTNIVSGFLITDRMLKMFKQERKEVKP
ncbi:MAG: NAD(P) transhydrogenase subunit alpha [bacterium]